MYPEERILQYSDDASGCFNQRQFHPNMTGANASMFQNYLCFPVGMHFGGIWHPANSEPISRAKGEMAKFMFKHCSFTVDMNLDVLKQLKVDIPTLQEPLAIATLLPGVPPQSNPDGTIKFHYSMYVDDS